MSKNMQAVIQGFVLSIVLAGVLTIIWAILFHFVPSTWLWVKSISAFINYSFALYIGILSAALRTKAMGINAPLYVMLLFFFGNIILRAIFVAGGIQFGMAVLKFVYSGFLFAVAFKHAQMLQTSYMSSRKYSRLR